LKFSSYRISGRKAGARVPFLASEKSLSKKSVVLHDVKTQNFTMARRRPIRWGSARIAEPENGSLIVLVTLYPFYVGGVMFCMMLLWQDRRNMRLYLAFF